MLWILLLSVIVGLAIGYMSYIFEEGFLAISVIILFFGAIIFIRVVWPLAVVAGASAGLGRGDPFTLTMALFAELPQTIQTAIIIFPLAAFAARFAAWFYAKATEEPEVIETKESRKQRIMEQYGYKDGLPD